MYSSCPNIIKHFVPIKFSQASLDSSSPRLKIDPKSKQIPFTNKKLQCLKNQSKDYILIFKNKTYKDYSPKKRVSYSTIIKNMKMKNNQAIKQMNLGSDGQFYTVQPNGNNKIQLFKNRKIQSVHKFRDLKLTIRQAKTSDDTQRIKFTPGYNSARQTKATFRSSKQNDYKSLKNQRNDNQVQEQLNSLVQFKIRGFKAPKSETVDFYKKLNLDNNYRLADKLVK